MERHLAMVSLPYRQPTVVDDQYIPPSKTTCYLFEKIFLSFRHLFSTFSKVRLFFFYYYCQGFGGFCHVALGQKENKIHKLQKKKDLKTSLCKKHAVNSSLKDQPFEKLQTDQNSISNRNSCRC